ncbi:MAG: hypothetical protein B6I34_09620 [Anaerolineaceae bacterium 4572_32.1]|nr:MAG: hypothetical protein B6I34_09620 [Anaerolineaceae bacterium 4572_32.1]
MIPPSYFYTFDVPEFGLVGYYYPNINWEGAPAVVQRDVFLTAGEVLPTPYSIIWQGKILVEQPGLYKFGLNSDDGSMLYLDERLVVDNGGSHGARYVEGSINLSGGYHDIELRYFQEGGSRELELWWTLPEGKRELIPPTILFPWEGEVPARQAEAAQIATPPAGAVADSLWRVWGEGAEMQPRGVAVSPVTGWVYVSDAASRRVQVFDRAGELLFAARCWPRGANMARGRASSISPPTWPWGQTARYT